MHFRKSVIVAASIGLVAATSLVGCSASTTSTGSGTTGKTSFNLVGVAANTSDPFWASLQCGATKEAAAEGSKITWYSSASDLSSSTQQANYNAAMLTKPDGLLIASWQEGTFSTQIKALMKGGTPVIGVNSTITPATERELFVGSNDNTAFVNYISKDLKGVSGSIGVLGGTAGDPGATLRWKPLITLLKTEAPNLKALPTQFDDYDRTKAATVTSALIVANPDLKAIYAISGPEGEGAAAAVQQAGKAGKIKVYSYGADQAEVAGLKSGVFAALAGQPAAGQGAAGAKAMIAFLKTHKAGTPVTQVSPLIKQLPLKTLTKANVDDPSSASFLESTSCN
jgi:ribose transport system substrate-binding protein